VTTVSDSFVDAVAVALAPHYVKTVAQSIARCACGVTISGGVEGHQAAVAVAALVAVAEGSDLAMMLQRERIALDIEAARDEYAHDIHDPGCPECQAIASLTRAAAIARGNA
jgi:hypothetical protein